MKQVCLGRRSAVAEPLPGWLPTRGGALTSKGPAFAQNVRSTSPWVLQLPETIEGSRNLNASRRSWL